MRHELRCKFTVPVQGKVDSAFFFFFFFFFFSISLMFSLFSKDPLVLELNDL